ncbi:hypothetical protein KQI65_13790 [bacterium]|nr:hypothetical protein [bacterium]
MQTVRIILILFLLSVPSLAHSTPGRVADFKLEITWPQEGMHNVYVQRPFELRITPCDSDGNAIDTLLRVRLGARFPGEFDAASMGYFQFPFEIRGATSIMLTPSFKRVGGMEQQRLLLYSEDSVHSSGQSEQFFVLPHPPSSFSLEDPPPDGEITVWFHLPNRTAVFSWEKPEPPDPYDSMRRTINDSTRWSDSVRYTLSIANIYGTTIFRCPSDSAGALPRATVANGQLIEILRSQGCRSCRYMEFFWFVEATDGIDVTTSSPTRSGFILEWEIWDGVDSPADALGFELETNIPNPFHSSTQISFNLLRMDRIRLTLLNSVGEIVKVLAEGDRSPGRHMYTMNAGELVPGPYFIRLETTSGAQTRKILLLR